MTFTPDGRADAVVGGDSGFPCSAVPPPAAATFALPEERRLTLSQFLDVMAESRARPELGVPYLSAQNSNLTQELAALLPDVEVRR